MRCDASLSFHEVYAGSVLVRGHVRCERPDGHDGRHLHDATDTRWQDSTVLTLNEVPEGMNHWPRSATQSH